MKKSFNDFSIETQKFVAELLANAAERKAKAKMEAEGKTA